MKAISRNSGSVSTSSARHIAEEHDWPISENAGNSIAEEHDWSTSENAGNSIAEEHGWSISENTGNSIAEEHHWSTSENTGEQVGRGRSTGDGNFEEGLRKRAAVRKERQASRGSSTRGFGAEC